MNRLRADDEFHEKCYSVDNFKIASDNAMDVDGEVHAQEQAHCWGLQ